MLARRVLPLLAAVAALLVIAPEAFAAPVSYSVSLGNNQASSLALDGDQLVGLSLTAFVASCANGPSTYAMEVGLPATPTAVSANALHVETDGADQGYGASVHVVVDGTVTPDRHVISGTITLSGLQSVFDSGCPPTSMPFVAIPKPAVVPPDPEHQWTLSGGSMRADARTGHITRIKLNVPFACGGSVNAVDFDTHAYGLDDIATSPSGAFAVTLDVLDEYSVVRVLTITGQLDATSLSARFQVASTAVGGFLGDCAGDATFAATAAGASPAPQGPGTPAPTPGALPTADPNPAVVHQSLPRTTGPSASFNWAELRLTRGAAYSYYFLVDRLRCAGHATHVRIVAAGWPHLVSCSRSRGFGSGPLSPGVSYGLTAQAVRMRRGRIVSRGPAIVTLVRMRTAQDNWVPISNLPGTPPTH
ncbi:MAG TPA: hypothetical protein VII98_09315 [Solirubrobacteraceae bacterium]